MCPTTTEYIQVLTFKLTDELVKMINDDKKPIYGADRCS